MSDEMVLENGIGADGVRRVHVMGSADLTPGPFPAGKGSVEIPAWAEVKTWEDEIHLHHLMATWRAREVVEFDMPVGCAWKRDGEPDLERVYCQERCSLREARCHWRRKLLLWALEPDGKFVEQVVEASMTFVVLTESLPDYVFVKSFPKESGEVGEMLIEANWVPEGFVALWSNAFRLVEVRV